MNNTADGTVNLREVTAETFREITGLQVAPEQADYVAPNVFSIAESRFHPEAWFRGIYAGDTPVGFVMLEDWTQVPGSAPDLPVVLWRFMIDKQHQGAGYGRKALQLIVDHVRDVTGLDYMLTSCVEGDHSPKDFYLKFGFEPTGEFLDNETILRYSLK